MRDSLIHALLCLMMLGAPTASCATQYQQLAEQCMQCHGTETLFGDDTKFRAPKLGGQGSEYIVKALNEYLAASRFDNSAHGNWSNLTPSERSGIAEFYMNFVEPASLEPNASAGPSNDPVHSNKHQSYNDEEYDRKKKTCVICHSRDGNNPALSDIPKLAGQYREYLLHALQSYKSGSRTDAVMAEQVRLLDLSQTDMERMALHYSMQSGLMSVAKSVPRGD